VEKISKKMVETDDQAHGPSANQARGLMNHLPALK
jgi:hypothetical protein